MSVPAQASLPAPLTAKDVSLVVGQMAKLHLSDDDWSPGVEHIEMACLIRDRVLVRCRVQSAVGAEREALAWAFDYASKVRVAPRDRGGGLTYGRILWLEWNFRPGD